mmetsp:Transcript_38916/g.61305  ORF Transcript_38916/g.61305 Transcript_38916/m.61305 type:complete len:202 (-) Transcript_38916:1115-1720(-)
MPQVYHGIPLRAQDVNVLSHHLDHGISASAERWPRAGGWPWPEGLAGLAKNVDVVGEILLHLGGKSTSTKVTKVLLNQLNAIVLNDLLLSLGIERLHLTGIAGIIHLTQRRLILPHLLKRELPRNTAICCPTTRLPESVIEICKDQISRRVNSTAQRSIEVTLCGIGDVVVRVCLAVSNGTLHFWLYLLFHHQAVAAASCR